MRVLTRHVLIRAVIISLHQGRLHIAHQVPAVRGVHVVAANKKPLAEPQTDWQGLMNAARGAHRFYNYETTVGASLPVIYWKIILPSLRPVFFSSVMVLAHIAIKSFDLVMAMTAGGPGYSTDLPAVFMYAHTFTRGQMGLGSASAMLMLGAILALLVPYLYSELREKRHD